MNIVNKIICALKGHKRGKRLSMSESTGTRLLNHFRCPRCGAEWTRKAKA